MTVPFASWASKFQPYPAFFCAFFTSPIVMFLIAQVFIPSFNVDSFLYIYLMLYVDIGIFVGYKLIFRSKFVKPEEVFRFEGD